MDTQIIFVLLLINANMKQTSVLDVLRKASTI